MAGIRLEFAQFGHFDSFDVIRSLTSMVGIADVDLPIPIATDLKIMYYVDVNIVKGVTYYYKVRVWRGSECFVSDEVSALAGVLWTPDQMVYAPKLHLSGENVVKDSSSRISQATDLSGNNYHLTQTANNYKPLSVIDPILNKPVFSFDGSDDHMTGASAAVISRNINKLWSFSVHKRNNIVVQTNTIFRYLVSSGSAGRFAHYAGTGGKTKVGLGTRRLDSDSIATLYDTEDTGTDWTISLAYHDYSIAQSLVVINGNAYSTSGLGSAGNTSNTSANPAYFGAENTSGGYLNGCVAVLLSGNTVLSQAEIDKLFGWAAHKYGLSDRLPIDHPYKNLIPMQD